MGKIRERLEFEETYLLGVITAAARSSCLYLPTGAVIVKDKRIIASGYNGAPPRVRNCYELGCRKDKKRVEFNDKGRGVCRGIHAEVNAMDQIARKDLKGASLYSLHLPCSSCAKEIVGSGIEEVFYLEGYEEEDNLTKELFSEAGVRLAKINLNLERCFKLMRKARYWNKK